MPFQFKQLTHPEIILATPQVFDDKRGYLLESYDKTEFEKVGIKQDFVLDFYSRSQKDVLRGLHVQVKPAAQAKLVHVITGGIYDVVVDVRPESDRFGEYITRRISGSDKEVLYIPEGFAHGYLVLEDETVVHYKGTHEYSPDHIRGVIWNDPRLDIEWPIDEKPILSEQDESWPTLQEFQK